MVEEKEVKAISKVVKSLLMAIYHFSTQSISRSQGRTVIACAAYRAAEKLEDYYYGTVYDYSRKQGVAYKDILLPEGAPQWMKKREFLWNHIEMIEKRKDSRLAREVQFSLLRELSFEQNKALAQEFVRQTFVNQGMVADLCIHTDTGTDGQEQPHCHVLLATRTVNEEGFGLKNSEWNKKERLLEWREAWANSANQHLALHGYDVKIDHRSYVDQKIDLEPQYKIGTAKLRRREERLADHQRIAQENGERIYHHPEIALGALTKQQSTFTPQDLARFIHRHSASAEQFHKVYDRIQVDPELVRLGKDAQGQERLTTREMIAIEGRMLKNAHKLRESNHGKIDERIVEGALGKRHLSEEQETALRYITERGDLKCVLGYAGTGKSYLLEAAREVWESSGYRMRGTALSGIATQNLHQSSGIESRTTASLFYSWDKGREGLTARDILVIDEAGMLGSRQMERIITEAQDKGAKVVMLGDWQQLQAIEAGAAFRAIAEEHHYIELKEVRRQGVSWQREATIDLARGQVGEAVRSYQDHDQVHSFETQKEAKQRLIEQWNDVRHTHPQESQLIMAYTRQDVKDLNEMARELKQQDGELGQSHAFEMERGVRDFATGDRVYFLKREDGLGVINGTLGTIIAINSKIGQIQVKLDQGQLSSNQRQVTVDTSLYPYLDHGYAATVHKAQGTTVDRSYLLTSKSFDAHSTYVGMSRHRQSCDVFSSGEQFKDDKELISTLSRDRTKDVTLDYTKPWLEYVRQREIEPHPRLDSLMDLEQRLEQRAEFYQSQANIVLERKSPEEQEPFWRLADQFTAQFEQKYPDVAKRINDSFIPEHEKQAASYIKQFKAYAQNLFNLGTEERQKFTQLTKEMMSSSAIMNHISCNDEKLATKIREVFDRQEREHARHHEHRFSYKQGFGW